MSKILKVSQGDYIVEVLSTPTNHRSIKLDTGIDGSVIITGDLDVQGRTTTIESVNATIVDNIIVLNNNEPHTNGAGITLGSAGIRINRGKDGDTDLSANLLFDETVSHYNAISNTTETGTYVLSTLREPDTGPDVTSLAGLQISSVELSAITSNGVNGITFNLRNSNTTIAVINSTYNSEPYETRLNDSSLTNKKFVTTYVVAGLMTPGMADVDKIYYKDFSNNIVKSKILATSTSQLQFTIDDVQRAVVDTNGLTVDTTNVFNNTIKNTGVDPLILTSDANLVELNGVLALDDQSSTPTLISNKTQLYSSATAGSGKSGLFFKNTTTTDELVAKNRALLFSMLF